MKTIEEQAYKPYLDGVRGIAILLVALSHGGFDHVIPGGLGVTIFFFISGYLITNLLLKEMKEHGTIRLDDFYMRRLWRLMPALLVYLNIALIIYLFFNQQIDAKEPISALLYLSNYYNIFYSYDLLAGGHSMYSVLWSLAIEEHFYLFFAPLVAIIKNRQRLIFSIFLFLIFPLIIRGWVTYYANPSFSEKYTYYATDARLDSIAYGCLLAIFGHQRLNWIKPGYAVTLGLIGLIFSLLYRDDYFRQVFRYSLQGISLYLIFEVLIFSKKIVLMRRLLSVHFLVFVGKLSYSMYLYHWLALIIMIAYLGKVESTAAWQIGYWMLTFGLSALSYYFVERPTLKLRVKYGSHAG
jgi:peptidoglycan/LPS O-acetylase OafA/YrhL